MDSYDTVVEAINGLKSRGYTIDFNVQKDKIVCSENKYCLDLNQFEITEVYRFEGDTNPSDEDVVYAVKSYDDKIKGIITSAYGTYADNASTEMLRKLSMHT